MSIRPLLGPKRTQSAEKRTLRSKVCFPHESGHSHGKLRRSVHSHKRTSASPKAVEHWSLTTLREKLIKIGATVVSHGRYVTFQLAKVTVPRELFRKILSLIDDLRRRPAPT